MQSTYLQSNDGQDFKSFFTLQVLLHKTVLPKNALHAGANIMQRSQVLQKMSAWPHRMERDLHLRSTFLIWGRISSRPTKKLQILCILLVSRFMKCLLPYLRLEYLFRSIPSLILCGVSLPGPRNIQTSLAEEPNGILSSSTSCWPPLCQIQYPLTCSRRNL